MLLSRCQYPRAPLCIPTPWVHSPTLHVLRQPHQPDERTTICTNLMNVPPSTFNIHSVQLSTFNIHSVQLSIFNIHSVQLSTFKIHSVQLSTFNVHNVSTLNVHNVPPSNYRHQRFVPFAHIALSTALNTQF